MTQHGEGVPVDIPKAINFYRQAADLGDTSAMIALGDIFADPKLDLYSIEEARKFYKKAYENGDSLAPAILARTYNPFISGYQDSTNSKKVFREKKGVMSRKLESGTLKPLKWRVMTFFLSMRKAFLCLEILKQG